LHSYRTHTCGALRAADEGQAVRLSGWLASKRDHGGLIFVDLRDHHGLVQLVAEESSAVAADLAALRRESVIRIDGTVQRRPAQTQNDNLPTGEIEVAVTDLEVLGEADVIPFPIQGDDNVGEDVRLTYRYLDLRRERLHANMVTRSRIIASIRERMTAQGFLEMQTPILTSSSPEGARDYLVPSRRHPGRFYALPQAPQQFKQLLMLAGFDRYFQIAACFRDEDARADRSPGEFYQLDLEMSFATQEDVFAVLEEVLSGLFDEFGDREPVTTPFVRIPYAASLDRFGSDKPDLRIPTEVVDVTDLTAGLSFRAFDDKVVRALRLPGAGDRSRSWFDRLNARATELGAAGLAWLTLGEGDAVKGPVAKFFDAATVAGIAGRLGAVAGDALALVADADGRAASKVLGVVRTETAAELGIVDTSAYRFCWITDFPMYERADDGSIEFSHNPFSMPQGGLAALDEQDPLDVLAYQYDIVCDGYELSSGAVRNHSPELMRRAFEIAGYAPEEVQSKFPALLNAFRYGAPPHAGIAPGIDRIVMLLTGEETIREVIAFPMNQQAQDLMMNAPSEVSEQQLRDVHIRLATPPAKGATTMRP
jgi:aspartyl-tRNA synthetase